MKYVSLLVIPVAVQSLVAAEFEAPMQVKLADGSAAGTASGYAAPAFADVDGDGLKDLVVGDFSGGVLRYYKNEGSAEVPVFKKLDFIKTDGKKAQVPGVW